MLPQVTAVRFDKQLGSGRTKPCLFSCVGDDGTEVEVVAKFIAGCERGVGAMVAEALAAMLASDLDLPVPEPFVVLVDDEFAAAIPDPDVRARAQKSLGPNFGSRRLPPGFSTYPKAKQLPQELLTTGAEILAFDTLIANPDRTVANPNLLINGVQLAIFDHELAMFFDGLIGWRAPWEPDAVRFPRGQHESSRHIFLEEVRGKCPRLERLSGAIEALTDDRLAEYHDSLPASWLGDGSAVNQVLGYITKLRANVDAALANIEGALR